MVGNGGGFQLRNRHSGVFDALARFLPKGHSVHIIRGNHDAEFHWGREVGRVDGRRIIGPIAHRGRSALELSGLRE